jgi:2-amino-4-hydroxy-6-hydroxymethyldihydropteridine diphosphokinase
VTEPGVVNAWLSVGSNVMPRRYIELALHDLEELFGELRISPVYESEAIGVDGDNFLNLVVGINTDLSPGELVAELKRVEARHGRKRSADKFAPRTLDIDLLTYGDRVVEDGSIRLPRDEILKYAFVLLPLSEVAGDEIHPQSGRTYRQLWEAFDKREQPLWLVEKR